MKRLGATGPKIVMSRKCGDLVAAWSRMGSTGWIWLVVDVVHIVYCQPGGVCVECIGLAWCNVLYCTTLYCIV